jgi:hypothetical protein
MELIIVVVLIANSLLGRFDMKKLLPIVLLMAGIAAAQAGSVSTEQSLAARRAECFLKHGHLMEKPALRNEWNCWRVHAYLMERN